MTSQYYTLKLYKKNVLIQSRDLTDFTDFLKAANAIDKALSKLTTKKPSSRIELHVKYVCGTETRLAMYGYTGDVILNDYL